MAWRVACIHAKIHAKMTKVLCAVAIATAIAIGAAALYGAARGKDFYMSLSAENDRPPLLAARIG